MKVEREVLKKVLRQGKQWEKIIKSIEKMQYDDLVLLYDIVGEEQIKRL